ncbi:MAG: hypothetical protein V4505_05430 [Pseudomonadota bacterium]
MSTKRLLIYGYLGIALLFALYFTFFGSNPGFFRGLGQGLVWPAVLFPGIGKLIGGVVLLVFLAVIWLV